MLTHLAIRRVILALSILSGLLLIIFSIVPINRFAIGTRTPSHSPAAVERAAFTHLAVHVVLFGTLSAGAWFAAQSKTGKSIALTLTLLLGCGTEYLEHQIGRGPLELNDIVTNLGSSVSVFVIITLIHHFRKKLLSLP